MLSAVALWHTALLRRELGISPVFPVLLRTFSKMGHRPSMWPNVSFHKPLIYFCHQTSAKQQLSWPEKRKKGWWGSHLHTTFTFPHVRGHFQLGQNWTLLTSAWATGNSHKLEPGKFQGERSKKFPVRPIKFCNKLQKTHAVTAVWQTLKIILDNAPNKETWAGPALRGEQVTFGVSSQKNWYVNVELIFLWSITLKVPRFEPIIKVLKYG